MRTTVIIQNLKCDTCRNTVVAAIDKFDTISNVDIDINLGTLSFDYKSHNAMEGLRFELARIGHPITEDPSIIRRPNLEIESIALRK